MLIASFWPRDEQRSRTARCVSSLIGTLKYSGSQAVKVGLYERIACFDQDLSIKGLLSQAFELFLVNFFQQRIIIMVVFPRVGKMVILLTKRFSTRILLGGNMANYLPAH